MIIVSIVNLSIKLKKSLSFPKDYFIERKLTRITPVTIGPVFEMLTFSIEALDIVTSKIEKIIFNLSSFW